MVVRNTVLGGTKLEQTIHNSYAALDDNVIHEHWRDPNNAIIDLILEFPYDKAADENQSGVASDPPPPPRPPTFFLGGVFLVLPATIYLLLILLFKKSMFLELSREH